MRLVRGGPALVGAVAIAVAAIGCGTTTVASSPPAADRVGGPGWSIVIPANLGLAPGPVPPTELSGTWEARAGDGIRQVDVLVNRETGAPLDDHFGRVDVAPGSRIEAERAVEVATGRATWFRVRNTDQPPHELVLVEPSPGTIVSIAGIGIGSDALVAIARSLVVEER